MIVLCYCCDMGLFGGDKNARFWKWFVAHETEFFSATEKDEALLDAMSRQLHKISPYACFELSPTGEKQRTLVISTDGIAKGIPAVLSLVEAAPKLDQWNFVAFRPRNNDVDRIVMGDIELKSSEMLYTYSFNSNNLVDIKLYIKGYKNDLHDPVLGAAFVLLDSIIGEYDVMTKVGLIDLYNLDEKPKDVQKLPTLAKLLDTRRPNE